MDHMMRLVLVSLCTLYGVARALGVLGEYPYVFAAVPLHAPVPVVRVLMRAPPRPSVAASSRYGGAVADPLRHFAEPLRQYATETSRPYAVGAPLRHFAEPPTRHYAAETDAEYETSQYSYSRPSYYLPPPGHAEEAVLYAQGQRGEASGEAGSVLYARLTPTGGYTYRRAPAASNHHLRKTPAPPPPPPVVPAPAPTNDKDPQYILKIHKYRIIKD